MLKKTITYTDFNGKQRTEDFYFNLTKAEVAEMEATVDGGFSTMLGKIVASNDPKRIVETFKDLVLKAYGEKSDDGRRFMKNPEIKQAFAETEAYSEIFMDLAMNAEAAADFVNGIMPSMPNK